MAHTNQIASDQSYSESTVRLKAVKILIGKSPVCRTACQCIKEFELDKQQTDAMVLALLGPLRICGTNLPVDEVFCKKSIYRDILGINIHNQGYPRDIHQGS